MAYDFIEVKAENQIATITLNRPEKRNAFHGPMIEELNKALDAAGHMDQTIALLIRANGEHFSAGADIKWMQEISKGSYEKNYDDAQYLADLMHTIYCFPKPTIAVVQGAAMGGGLGIMAVCDIAIGTEDTSFAFSEVKIGLAPSTISPYVVAAMGERAAHYYFLTGEKFDAIEAKRLGLLHQVIPIGKLAEEVTRITDMLMKNSPHAMKEVKKLLRTVSQEKIGNKLSQKTAEHLANLRVSPQAKEGLRAFSEKREPVWNEEK